MSGTRLGRGHVIVARFRQSARGKAAYLEDDLLKDDRLPAVPGRVAPVSRDAEPEDAPAPRQRVEASLMPSRPDLAEVPVIDRDAGPPIAPPWVRHPVAAVRRVLAHWAHVTAFHFLRLPQYAGQALRWSPRGLFRIVVGLYRWVTDGEAKELRWDTAARRDTKEYGRLSRQRDRRVHNRGWAVAVLVPAAITAVVAAVMVSPYSPLTRIVVAVAVIAGLGGIGAPADRPWIEHATVPPGARKITPDLLVQAFAAAKLCSIEGDKPGPLRFLSPIAHDGPGVRAVVELPAGVTADTAVKRRVEIASGLNIDEFRVFLERVRGTEGSARRVVVWIADRDPYEASSTVTPLATARTWDFWQAFPFGVDARGRGVAWSLVWTSFLVGSIPRMGKSNAARIVVAAAALDPTTRLIVFDGKGGKDWQATEAVAHFYAAGTRKTVVEALVGVLQDAVEDMDQRFERMRKMPDDVCPEGKVTPQITRRPHYGMPLTVVCVDEVHRYLEHPEHGGTIEALLTELAKVGPAAGIMLVLATQRPDAKVIPAGLRDQMGTRFALKVMTWQSSEVVLGAGTYGAGLNAAEFLKEHVGVGILLGADDSQATGGGALTVRTHELDLPVMRTICDRAREARAKAGLLTGMAAGESVLPETPRRRLLDDLLDVFEPAEAKVWSEVLCARLAERWPDQYDGWQATTLANTLRSFGIETSQTWGRTETGEGANRRGVARQDLLDTIAERELERPSDRQLTSG